MYEPQDVISPIISAIADIVHTQISGVSQVYEQPPDGPPEDGTVEIPLSNYKIADDTNGKLCTHFTFGLRHFVVRGSFPENVLAAYAYWWPYMQAFSRWSNQSLGGRARLMTVTNGGVTQFVQAGQVFVCLIVNLEVQYEFNIPTD
ncbi:hypothetical protein [Ktedonospora formicarum]|uniref:Uncharacterized protein n=1 Tax=Ktedonospora formicarum TaxID=2778364 RepID=A0A8J3MST6_9CHLR|nr:hypothetical protein [Ktedonospora formicarum]GHO45191.1 hypothetical protein KSX_33540 [Ktedonospora formicarum]